MNDISYEQFWNERGKTPADKWSEDKYFRVLNILEQLNFDSVLEVGCGDGQFSNIILSQSVKATGIDLSKERLSKSPYEKTIYGDFLKHPFIANRFDLVCCSHVLLHIRPEEVELFYKKMKDLAKKYVILIEPDMFQYENHKFKSFMNYPHDYRKLDDFILWDLKDKVVLFLKEL